MTPRIFVTADALAAGADFALPAHAVRHVAQVLRMRPGAPLTLFTGAGGEYAATIARIERRDVLVHVERHDAIERESPWPVTLVQAVIAADSMDWIVRKAVELGVAAIAPVQAARSQTIPDERAARRAGHWRQIAIAACEQCGRNRVPPIAPVVSFAHWAEAPAAASGAAMLDADARGSLAALAAGAPPRAIAVGPEGGWTPEELAHAERHGTTRVHVGRRVLRAETAALAALATVNAAAGDAR